MFQRILIQDLKRRKSITFILFLFVILASVFLCSSANNIISVVSAIDYNMEYSNIPDHTFILPAGAHADALDSWLSDQTSVSDFQVHDFYPAASQKLDAVRSDGSMTSVDIDQDLYFCDKNMKYFKIYTENGDEFSLSQGEAACSSSFLDRYDLDVGDAILLAAGERKITVTIHIRMKDAAFGSSMMGLERIVLNEKDLELFSDAVPMKVFGVDTNDNDVFNEALGNQEFIFNFSIAQSTYQLLYVFDLILAGMLMAIGICLILIALLVLRFTLVFTLEEDYKEIGIMKAIGMRGFSIKKLYLIKYTVIVLIGTVTGILLSIPVSDAMISSVSVNILIPSSDETRFFINILVGIGMIIGVSLCCYLCCGRLDKISPIVAINDGASGERFHKKSPITLRRRLFTPPTLFLAGNDILSSTKRYLLLLFTFCISMILITIPLNVVNTMKSDEMTQKFIIDPKSVAYTRHPEAEGETTYSTVKELLTGNKRLEQEIKDVGYASSVSSIGILMLNYKKGSDSQAVNIMTTQLIGDKESFESFDTGYAPKEDNEIAFSKKIMEERGYRIGDTICTVLGGVECELIITATYTNYMQLGESAILSPSVDTSAEENITTWVTMVDMNTDLSQEESVALLNEVLPSYQWITARQLIDNNVGNIQGILQDMLPPLTALLSGVIMLITALMERLFLIRERGEIAMLKSIGFRTTAIVGWHTFRMLFVALLAVICLIPLSLLSNKFLLENVFGIMGAEVNIQTNPLNAYLVYPGILIAGIIIITLITAFGSRKINVQETST